MWRLHSNGRKSRRVQGAVCCETAYTNRSEYIHIPHSVTKASRKQGASASIAHKCTQPTHPSDPPPKRSKAGGYAISRRTSNPSQRPPLHMPIHAEHWPGPLPSQAQETLEARPSSGADPRNQEADGGGALRARLTSELRVARRRPSACHGRPRSSRRTSHARHCAGKRGRSDQPLEAAMGRARP